MKRRSDLVTVLAALTEQLRRYNDYLEQPKRKAGDAELFRADYDPETTRHRENIEGLNELFGIEGTPRNIGRSRKNSGRGG